MLQGPGGNTYTLTGSFTGWDANGFPLQGTVESFQVSDASGMLLSTSGYNIPASTFGAYVAANDAWGLYGVMTTGGDIIAGRDFSDFIYGAAGQDQLFGNGGADTLDGGGNHDTLVAGAGADLLVGGEGDNNAWAGAGDDVVVGGSGAEVLAGQAGADTLWGGAGTDFLLGGDGNDALIGQGGGDYLAGGAGADAFYIGAADGSDWIADFNRDEGDRIYLQNGVGYSAHEYDGLVAVTLTGGAVIGIQGATMDSLGTDWLVYT